jgi:hypothetical protein
VQSPGGCRHHGGATRAPKGFPHANIVDLR